MFSPNFPIYDEQEAMESFAFPDKIDGMENCWIF